MDICLKRIFNRWPVTQLPTTFSEAIEDMKCKWVQEESMALCQNSREINKQGWKNVLKWVKYVCACVSVLVNKLAIRNINKYEVSKQVKQLIIGQSVSR